MKICNNCNKNIIKNFYAKQCRNCWKKNAVCPNKGKKTGLPAWNRGLPSPFRGIKRSPEIGKKISDAKLKSNFRHTEDTRKRISISRMGKCVGKNNYQWIEDKTKLKRTSKQGERRSYAYFFWKKSVWERDNFKCKILNEDCKGRLEVHHILSWRDYPELRYEINNGITLCHAHHPRKRAEEQRLSPYFQELVSVSKE